MGYGVELVFIAHSFYYLLIGPSKSIHRRQTNGCASDLSNATIAQPCLATMAALPKIGAPAFRRQS